MSNYRVYITPQAFQEIKDLPGHMRQRVRREIRDLAQSPRPSHSKALDVPEFEYELRRLKLDKWRVVYLIIEADSTLSVLAVRKRPPYDYGDLGSLIKEV